MPRNTRNEEQIHPYQPPNDAERNKRAWGLIIHEQMVGTSRNPERRTTKGSSWENFQPSRDGINSLGKNDKRKDSQKAEIEKVRCRSLEGREIRGQLSRDTPKRKVSKRLLGKKYQKKKTIKKQGRD